MIQKRSWILLVIFIILLVLVLFFEKTPSLKNNFVTPSPTGFLKLIPGWAESDLVSFEFFGENEEIIIGLKRMGDTSWQFSSIKGIEPDQGKIQELLSSVFGLEVWNKLDPISSPEQYGLQPSVYTISLKNILGEYKLIFIGKETTTGSGYYIRVDDADPVVVNKYGIEGILQLMSFDALRVPSATSFPFAETPISP